MEGHFFNLFLIVVFSVVLIQAGGEQHFFFLMYASAQENDNKEILNLEETDHSIAVNGFNRNTSVSHQQDHPP